MRSDKRASLERREILAERETANDGGAQREAGGRVFGGTCSAASFRIWQLGKVLKDTKQTS